MNYMTQRKEMEVRANRKPLNPGLEVSTKLGSNSSNISKAPSFSSFSSPPLHILVRNGEVLEIDSLIRFRIVL